MGYFKWISAPNLKRAFTTSGFNLQLFRLPFFIIVISSLVTATSGIAVKSQYLQSIIVQMGGMTASDASFVILTLGKLIWNYREHNFKKTSKPL